MAALDQVPLASVGIALVAHDADDVLAELGALFARPAWQADAACREHRDTNFHPRRGEDLRAAKAVCAGCLVREECLAFALEHDTRGVWGGTSSRQRGDIAAGRLTVAECLAAPIAAAPAHKPERAPVVRSGAGACDLCGRVCRPRENPHDRLRAGLCPAHHRAFMRWRRTHWGDRADFIRARLAA